MIVRELGKNISYSKLRNNRDFGEFVKVFENESLGRRSVSCRESVREGVVGVLDRQPTTGSTRSR
jgi:hypothetical protein